MMQKKAKQINKNVKLKNKSNTSKVKKKKIIIIKQKMHYAILKTQNKVTQFFDNYSSFASEAKFEEDYGGGLEILIKVLNQCFEDCQLLLYK